jgi:MGT family glycosyltransferase
LGSFFSARADLLRKLVRAFERQDVDVVMASGITDVTELGDVPPSWTVEPFLPQTAVLTMSDLVVTHGGNNTVTEAFTAGVPMLVGPLSTDQFSGAVDVEESGLGMVFDPNADSPATIAEMAQAVLASDAPDRSKALSRDLLSRPGATVAADLLESHLLASVSVDRGERR